MEALPVEIADKILDQIFRENPQDLCQLRLISQTWKNITDRCTSRLVNVWCKKCSDEIPEKYLDDIIRTRYPQFASWQEYCSNEFPLPHIARNIYVAWTEVPNLTHHEVCFTKLCPVPNISKSHVTSYAVNDNYFAISWRISMAEGLVDGITRIYSLDLSHCIREYPFPFQRMDFYATDNQVFLVVLEYDDETLSFENKYLFLAEFLVNEYLVCSDLAVKDCYSDTHQYIITKNQCFTYDQHARWFRHHQWTSNGFDISSRTFKVRCPALVPGQRIINMQICGSKLLMFVDTIDILVRRVTIMVYQYEIIRETDKLSFSGPAIHNEHVILRFGNTISTSKIMLNIDFGAGDILLKHNIGLIHVQDLDRWVSDFFKHRCVTLVTVYRYHVIIKCCDVFIVFRGSLRELMDYAEKSVNPGSRCNVIDLKSHDLCSSEIEDGASIIVRIKSKPKFLVQSYDKVVTIELLS